MSTHSALLTELRQRIGEAKVFGPQDVGYTEASTPWNLAYAGQPALVVRPENIPDLQAAVFGANKYGLQIAVQGTGHNVGKNRTGSLLINTQNLQEIHIDPHARSARVGAGVLLENLINQASQHGLTTLAGSSPNVGVVGLVQGGGIGWLYRRYGAAADYVRAYTVVTARGQIIRTNDTTHPDLFWALRGGGGSFGVIAEVELELLELSSVFGGFLVYPAAAAAQVFSRYQTWVGRLPDEWTTSLALVNYPDLPEIPPPLRGQAVVEVRGCYCGQSEQGKALLRAWHQWQNPLVEMFSDMSPSQLFAISHDPVDPLPAYIGGADYLTGMGAAEPLIRLALPNAAGHCPLLLTEFRHIQRHRRGKEMAFSPPPDAQFLLLAVGLAPTAEIYHGVEHHVARFREALAPLTVGCYLNFLEGPKNVHRANEAFTQEGYEKLVRIKNEYDPNGLFAYSYF